MIALLKIRRFVLSVLAAGIGAASAETAVLTLSERPAANLVTQVITAFGSSDSDIYRWSGRFEVEVEIDSASGGVVFFEMLGGNISVADSSFTFSGNFIFPYSQTVENLDVSGGAVSTEGGEILDPPDLFDATRHGFVFDSGRAESSGTFGASTTQFEDEPISAFGVSTGEITAGLAGEVRSAKDGVLIAKRYPLSFSLALDSTDTEAEITVVTTGTITASGSAMVFEHPFYEWFALAFPEEGEVPDFAREGVRWALGLEVGAVIPLAIVEDEVVLTLPAEGSRAAVILEWSPDLKTWQPLGDSIPGGTSGEVVVDFPTETGRSFIRVNAAVSDHPGLVGDKNPPAVSRDGFEN